MKTKQIIFILAALVCFSSALSAQQKLKGYVRFNVGVDAGLNGMALKPEVGLRWWFIDASLSLPSTTSLPLSWGLSRGDMYSSLMLNASIDLVKIFSRDCPHGLLIGGGLGKGRGLEVYTGSTGGEVYLVTKYVYGCWMADLRASYHYEFKNGLSVGAYYEMLIQRSYNLFGLSIGKTF